MQISLKSVYFEFSQVKKASAVFPPIIKKLSIQTKMKAARDIICSAKIETEKDIINKIDKNKSRIIIKSNNFLSIQVKIHLIIEKLTIIIYKENLNFFENLGGPSIFY